MEAEVALVFNQHEYSGFQGFLLTERNVCMSSPFSDFSFDLFSVEMWFSLTLVSFSQHLCASEHLFIHKIGIRFQTFSAEEGRAME